MIQQDRFALNRSVYPHLDVAEFFALASRLGIHKVELRNDIPGGVLNGRSPEELMALAKKHGIKIIAINSVENFNVASHLPDLLRQLPELLKVATSIQADALLLCPSHSESDRRSRAQIAEETVGALKALRPYFEESKVFGYVEPIGFKECSMRSLLDAMKAIRESGRTCYKITYDTFHHVTGPDTRATIEKEYDVSCTGLVHASGVTGPTPPDQYTDGMRAMPGPGDKIDNVGQISLLEKLGYRGDISFETFSPELHKLDVRSLEDTIRKSVQYLQKMTDGPANA
jgi:2-keto-myo-inositol isomerase